MTRKHAVRGFALVAGIGFVGFVVAAYLMEEAVTTSQYGVQK